MERCTQLSVALDVHIIIVQEKIMEVTVILNKNDESDFLKNAL